MAFAGFVAILGMAAVDGHMDGSGYTIPTSSISIPRNMKGKPKWMLGVGHHLQPLTWTKQCKYLIALQLPHDSGVTSFASIWLTTLKTIIIHMTALLAQF